MFDEYKALYERKSYLHYVIKIQNNVRKSYPLNYMASTLARLATWPLSTYVDYVSIHKPSLIYSTNVYPSHISDVYLDMHQLKKEYNQDTDEDVMVPNGVVVS